VALLGDGGGAIRAAGYRRRGVTVLEAALLGDDGGAIRAAGLLLRVVLEAGVPVAPPGDQLRLLLRPPQLLRQQAR